MNKGFRTWLGAIVVACFVALAGVGAVSATTTIGSNIDSDGNLTADGDVALGYFDQGEWGYSINVFDDDPGRVVWLEGDEIYLLTGSEEEDPATINLMGSTEASRHWEDSYSPIFEVVDDTSFGQGAEYMRIGVNPGDGDYSYFDVNVDDVDIYGDDVWIGGDTVTINSQQDTTHFYGVNHLYDNTYVYDDFEVDLGGGSENLNIYQEGSYYIDAWADIVNINADDNINLSADEIILTSNANPPQTIHLYGQTEIDLGYQTTGGQTFEVKDSDYGFNYITAYYDGQDSILEFEADEIYLTSTAVIPITTHVIGSLENVLTTSDAFFSVGPSEDSFQVDSFFDIYYNTDGDPEEWTWQTDVITDFSVGQWDQGFDSFFDVWYDSDEGNGVVDINAPLYVWAPSYHYVYEIYYGGIIIGDPDVFASVMPIMEHHHLDVVVNAPTNLDNPWCSTIIIGPVPHDNPGSWTLVATPPTGALAGLPLTWNFSIDYSASPPDMYAHVCDLTASGTPINAPFDVDLWFHQDMMPE